jgi:phage gpG-like protein
VTIKITVDNAAVNRAIAALGERANDLSPAFAEIGEYYVRRVDRRFEQEGPSWKSLSPRYAAWKARQPRAIQKKLQFGGLLRASINYKTTRRSVSIGSGKVYANRQNIDRPFLTPDSRDLKEFGVIILDHLRREYSE